MELFGSKISKRDFKEEQNRVDRNFEGMTTRIKDLIIQISKLETHLISLRGLVNRKLSKEAGETETKEFKSTDGLDDLRN